jgi:hypothetical protein
MKSQQVAGQPQRSRRSMRELVDAGLGELMVDHQLAESPIR